MKPIKPALFALSCATLFAACEVNTPNAATTQADDADAITAPIPGDAYKLALSLVGKPLPAADGKTITYQVLVENKGSAPVYGVGKADGSMAVDIGEMVLGDGDNVDGNGGSRDFTRVHLPLLAPGQAAVVAVNVPAAPRLDGRKLRLATVQEGVAWHEDDGSIDLGPFKLDGEGKFAGVPVTK